MSCLKKCGIAFGVFAVGICFLKFYTSGEVCQSRARLDGKVVIVTGANTGIGRETVLDLVQRGSRIIMACRSMERCTKSAMEIRSISGVKAQRLQTMHLDLSSITSIREFARKFKQREKRLDILINNAGVMWMPYQETEDGFETTFMVNHLGHFLLTNLLLDNLKKAPHGRIINVSSLAHTRATIDWSNLNGEQHYDSRQAYGQSKLANVLFNTELAKRLEGTNVHTYALHPGTTDTDLIRYAPFLNSFPVKQILKILSFPFMKHVWFGAQTTICCAVNEDFAHHNGKFYSDCKVQIAADHALDEKTAKKLWDISSRMVGIPQK